jgi:HPt (histidine-containing phosphotransfer) domain-containing protein
MRHPVIPPASGGPLAPKELPATNALDFVAALDLLDNSTALYLEAVRSYFQDIDKLPAHLGSLLSQPDLQEAARALHTHKGASLTIGAKLLSEVCHQCELQLMALRQSGKTLDNAARQNMQLALENAIVHTRQAIADVLADLGAQARVKGTSVLNTRALVEDLIALRNLLVRSDMRALARHKALCSLHTAATAQLQTLAPSLHIFDFAQAVVQCDELIRDFSAPL